MRPNSIFFSFFFLYCLWIDAALYIYVYLHLCTYDILSGLITTVDYIVNKNPVLFSHVLEYIIWRKEIDMCKPEIVFCHANIDYFLNSQMIYLGTNGELLNPLHLSIDEINN